MKKATLISLFLIQGLVLVGCGRPNTIPGSVSTPGSALGGDPYASGSGYGMSDPYASGSGYASTPGYGSADPYGSGSGYASTPGYGTGTGYGATDPYATGGYGMNNGYGATNGYGNTIDPVTGQPIGGQTMIDPVTGQPMMVNSQVSQQIVSKIQAAGGYRSGKADDAVRDSLKSISIQQALGAAPLDHKAMIIKTLLDGWASDEDRNFAQQVWNTIMPQQQQQLMSQDNELSKLVNDKLIKNKSNGIGAVFSEVGKLIGLGKSS